MSVSASPIATPRPAPTVPPLAVRLRLALLTLALHLSLPIWFRLLVAFFAERGLYGASFVVLPLLTPFAVSLFYSLFLPVFVDSTPSGLPPLYAAELLGAGAGVLILVGLGGMGLVPLMVIYGVIFLLIARQLGMPGIALLVVGGAAAAWLMALPMLNIGSNDRWYSATHRLPPEAHTVFTG